MAIDKSDFEDSDFACGDRSGSAGWERVLYCIYKKVVSLNKIEDRTETHRTETQECHQLREPRCYVALRGCSRSCTVNHSDVPGADFTSLAHVVQGEKKGSEGVPHLCSCWHLLSSVALLSHNLNCQRPMWLVCTITCSSKEARQGSTVNMLQGLHSQHVAGLSAFND